MKVKHILYILPLAGLVACEPEFDEVSLNTGSADFSSVVAVGNSLTAGFQSNALRRDKQINSYPGILAGQMQLAGGGSFSQPLLNDGDGVGISGTNFNSEFGIFLAADCQGTVGPSPNVISTTPQVNEVTNPASFIGASGPYNNVGVPGAKSYHLVAPGYGNPANILLGLANPYFARFADPTNPNETMIEHAMRSNPTFFSLWIGNNDVLSYATSGGEGVDQTGNTNPATYGSLDITDPNAFAGLYSQMVTALTANGAKGVLINIPDVTSIPYFTTVPTGTELDQASADALNAGYAAYNAGLDAAVAGMAITQAEADSRKITFSAGASSFVVLDSSLTDLTAINPGLTSMRQSKPGELMTLTLSGDSIRCAGWGTQKPISDEYHLTADELNSISTATAAYNSTIKMLADANGLAFYDANARLAQLASTGITVNAIAFTSAFISGGAFSLDGVHPSTRGYAIITNDVIEAINAKYGSKIPTVDVGSYDTYEIEM